MNILILGDIVGSSGREALSKKLPDLIKKKKLDFVIVKPGNLLIIAFLPEGPMMSPSIKMFIINYFEFIIPFSVKI